MSFNYRVGGYVKLAKLWEKNKEAALSYHKRYYKEKCDKIPGWILQGVYVDITGQKLIYKRPQMLHLLKACRNGEVDCIAAQTKAYLAANSEEFCYLLKFLSDMPGLIELVTEDEKYHINTIMNPEQQKEALEKMADDYVKLDETKYKKWKEKILQGIQEL